MGMLGDVGESWWGVGGKIQSRKPKIEIWDNEGSMGGWMGNKSKSRHFPKTDKL